MVAAPVVFRVGAFAETQSIAGLTVQPGATQISQNTYSVGTLPYYYSPATAVYGGSLQVNLGTISHSTGGTVGLFPLANGANGSVASSGFSTTSANVNGIIGGFLTLNGTDWASANSSGGIVAAAYTNNAWSATADVTATAANTNISSGSSVNSLRFANASACTITLLGTGTVNSGGILVSSAVGSHLSKITGGTLLPSTDGELFINQWDTSVSLEVDSVIADGGVPTALTLGGKGTVIATGANTFTGGTYLGGSAILSVSSDANLGLPSAASSVYFNGGTLTASAPFSLTNGSNPRPLNVGRAGGAINGSVTIPGLISGSSEATLTISGGTLTAANPFAGTVQAGISSPLILDNALALAHATLYCPPATPQNGATIVQFSSGIGNFTVAGLSQPAYDSPQTPSISLSDASGNPVNLIVGNDNQSSTFNGNLYGSGSLTKIGAGTLTLGGANSLTGGMLISGGTVIATCSTSP